MKKYLLLLLLFPYIINAADLPADKARGIFLAFGVGPRFPISTFSDFSELGYGFNAEISYTDNEYLPFFIFAKIGYDQYPGSQSLYLATDYNSYSVNALPIQSGIRYFFSPMFENVVLFIPILEVSAALTYYHTVNEFKAGTNRTNFEDDFVKVGVTVGAGISMFLMEILGNYTYFNDYQSVGIDLKVRLPLYINL